MSKLTTSLEWLLPQKAEFCVPSPWILVTGGCWGGGVVLRVLSDLAVSGID